MNCCKLIACEVDARGSVCSIPHITAVRLLPLLLVCWAFFESPLVQASGSNYIEVKMKLLSMNYVDGVGG